MIYLCIISDILLYLFIITAIFIWLMYATTCYTKANGTVDSEFTVREFKKSDAGFFHY